MQTGKHYLSFGGGTRLVSEDVYAHNMGISVRAFRGMCKMLRVPRVQIGSYWMVDRTAMELAIRWITRIGQPDFLTPGCQELAKYGKNAPRNKGYACELDVKQFSEHCERLLSELIYSKHLLGYGSEDALREQAKRATNRMLLAALQCDPSSELSRYSAKAKAYTTRLSNEASEKAKRSNV